MTKIKNKKTKQTNKQEVMSNASLDVGKGKHLFIADESTNWWSYYGNQYRVSSKMLKLDLPQHLAILLLGTLPKES